MISFTVPSVPIAQPRQRHRAFVTSGGKVVSHNYTPTKHPVNAFKAAVQQAFASAYSGPPLEGPVCVDLLFLLPRPKSMTKKRKPNPRAWHTCAPDTENMVKAVLDALTGLAWRNDAQVCYLIARKCRVGDSETPSVKVEMQNI